MTEPLRPERDGRNGVPEGDLEEVHLWVADLSGAPQGLEQLLSDSERERAMALPDGCVRGRWIASRAILRLLLRDWTGLDPMALVLRTGPRGKPRLEGPDAKSAHFNLSHSGNAAVFALSRGSEVGVDVEVADGRARPAGQEVGIARRFFGEEEAGRLAALPERQRRRRLLELWVAYEATVKCLGLGIGEGGLPQSSPRGGAAWVEELELGDGLLAALAVERGPAAVRQHRWDWKATACTRTGADRRSR